MIRAAKPPAGISAANAARGPPLVGRNGRSRTHDHPARSARASSAGSRPRDISYSAATHFLARRLGADARLIEDTSARGGGQPPGAAAPNTSLDSSALRARYGLVVPAAWEVLDGIL